MVGCFAFGGTMIRTQDIMKSLPLVASVLGDKYGVRVNIGGNSAYTDGKTINLPTLPLDCDETLLMLAKSYLDHEASHIRHTDFIALLDAQLTPVQKHLWNSIEDWRCENTLAALFPGCRQHFRWLIQHLFGKADENPASDLTGDPSAAVLDWVLLTVRSWDAPEIAPQRDAEAAIVDAAYPGLRASLSTILSRVRVDCASTQDAIAYALELSAVIENYALAVPPSEPDKGAQPTDSIQSNKTMDTDSQAQAEASDSCQQLEKLLRSSADELSKQVLQHIGEQLAATLTSQRSDSLSSLSVAVEGTMPVSVLDSDAKTEALQSTVALRTRLHGLLQAQTRHPCIPGRRGKLNPQRLHALAVHNPRVFVKWGERQGMSTAVHILLDTSGSMSGQRMELAVRACYSVAVALGRCKVNVGVTAFPAAPARGGNESTVTPLLRHGERMHDRFSVRSGGGTPLAESLWWVMQRMCGLKEHRKIIVLLSDGMPDSPASAEHAIKQAQSLGFEVMGLGIQDNNMGKLLPTASRTIYELTALAPAMFELLQTALLGGTPGHGGRP